MQSLINNAIHLTANFQISKDNIRDYTKNGFVKLENICSPEELTPFREELKETVSAFKSKKAPLRERDLYGKAFLQISNIWQRSSLLKQFVLAERFGKIAADLLGVTGVRLYHDQALYKEAGGGHTPWHQDQFYWPTESKAITMWMPLSDATSAMGLMEFIPERHTSGLLTNVGISESSDTFFKKLIQEERANIKTFDTIAAGSATFHSGWTPHRAGPNTTDKIREVMTIIFIENDATVSQPKNKNQESDLNAWLPGLSVGDICASPINPIIYTHSK